MPVLYGDDWRGIGVASAGQRQGGRGRLRAGRRDTRKHLKCGVVGELFLGSRGLHGPQLITLLGFLPSLPDGHPT